MIKKFACLFWILASVLLFGCTVKQNTEQFIKQEISPKTELPLSGIQTSRAYNMPKFDSITVNGPYDITFQYNTNPYINPTGVANVSLVGDSGILDYTQVFVKNNTLTLFLDPQYTYDPAFKAKIVIQSTAALKRIYYTGSGKIDIQGINTDHFAATVNGSAYMFLAGNANRFDGTATGTARLNAKCLVTKSTFVNTTDLAQAEVLGGSGVSALAAGQSDIYYYTRPDMAAPYQRQSGSAMSMVGIMPASVSVNTAQNPDGVVVKDDDYGIK